MKKTLIVSLTLCTILFSTSMPKAEDKAVNGLIIGMGSGALLGQAIGGDTESTVMGTAIGGILGFTIGHQQQHNHRYHGRHHGRYHTRHHHINRHHGHHNYHSYSSHGRSRAFHGHGRQIHVGHSSGHHEYRHRNSHHDGSIRIHRRDRRDSYNTNRGSGQSRKICKQTERTIYQDGRTKTIIKKVCTNDRGGKKRTSNRYRHGGHGSSPGHYIGHRW